MKKKNLVKKLVTMANVAMFTLMIEAQTILAAKEEKVDVSSVTKPIDNIKTLLTAIVGAIGYIILIKNIAEFANAFQDRDNPGMYSAVKGIVSGLLMAGVGTVLTIIGI